jgi:peptidyl-tRNA hydrolase
MRKREPTIRERFNRKEMFQLEESQSALTEDQIEWQKQEKRRNEALRVYVLVRRDILPLPQCGVQASHAIVEFAYKHKGDDDVDHWVTKDKTLVLLEATEGQIYRLKAEAEERGYMTSLFHEPDIIEDGLPAATACAIGPMNRVEGKQLFGTLTLVK